MALTWLALALWRTASTGSPRFVVLTLFAVVNAAVVARLISPGRSSA
ncbi:MAG TPA: hypothetical protein VGI64_01845 [Streptosporangiaceae bacterium]